MPDFLDREAIIYLLKVNNIINYYQYANYGLQYDTLKKSCDSLRVHLALKNNQTNNCLASSKKIKLEKLLTKIPNNNSPKKDITMKNNNTNINHTDLTNLYKSSLTSRNRNSSFVGSFYPGLAFKVPS